MAYECVAPGCTCHLEPITDDDESSELSEESSQEEYQGNQQRNNSKSIIVKDFRILNEEGEEIILVKSSSLVDLRCQLSSFLKTPALCISFYEFIYGEEELVYDEKWNIRYQLDDVVTLKAFNDTCRPGEISRWTEEEWEVNFETYASYGDGSIITALNRFAKKDIAKNIGEKALIKFCTHGHLDHVQKILEAGCSVDGKCGVEALLGASKKGHTEIVAFLFEKGVRLSGDDFAHACHHALVKDEMGLLHELLSHGVATSKLGKVLEIACMKGLTDIVMDLLGMGVNICRSHGKHALELACRYGYKDIVLNLVKYGADGLTALHITAKNGHTDIVIALLEQSKVDVPLEHGSIILAKAATCGYTDIVSTLIAHGISGTVIGLENAITGAAKNGYSTILSILLKAGVRIRGNSGGVALKLAATNGYKEILSTILKCGTQIPDEFYGAALVAASSLGLQEIVSLLITECISVIEPYLGVALKSSTRKGLKDICTLLLKHIDTKKHCSDCEVAYDIALYYGYSEILCIFAELGVSINIDEDCRALESLERSDVHDGGKLLRCVSRNGRADIVSILLKRGVDVSGKNGRIALECAATNGHEDIVSMLLDRGADVSGIQGSIALERACAKGHGKIVSLLIKHGVDLTDDHGGLAVEMACEFGHGEIVELLLERCVDIRGHFGDHAIQAACSHGYLEILETLLSRGADAVGYGHALCFAAHAGHNDIVLKLIDTDSTIVQEYGGAAVLHASRGGRQDVLQILLKHDVCRYMMSKDLWNAKRAAKKKKHADVASMLESQFTCSDDHVQSPSRGPRDYSHIEIPVKNRGLKRRLETMRTERHLRHRVSLGSFDFQ